MVESKNHEDFTESRCFFLQNPNDNGLGQGSESKDVFTDCQPQYPDLQGDFNADFTGLQEVSDPIRQLPNLTRHVPAASSVIEEIVEGFVESFLIRLGQSQTNHLSRFCECHRRAFQPALPVFKPNYLLGKNI